MAEKKEAVDFGTSGYILGIVSIVFGFVTPLAGLIIGIIGLVLSKREKTDLAKRGKTLSIIGIVISVVVLAITIGIMVYAYKTAGNFPLA